jgi:hypothetical protein
MASVSMPGMGSLRYDREPSVAQVTAVLSSAALVGNENYLYRIAKNGIPLPESEQIRFQGEFDGLVPIVLSTLVPVSGGDIFSVYVASSGTAVSISIEEFSLTLVELLTEIPLPQPPVPFPSTLGEPWPGYEDLVNRAVTFGPLSQLAVYTPVPDAPLTVRCVFDLDSFDIDLQTGLRVATGIPEFSVRDVDIGRASKVGDRITVAGTNYVVSQVLLSGQVGFSVCRLRLTA